MGGLSSRRKLRTSRKGGAQSEELDCGPRIRPWQKETQWHKIAAVPSGDPAPGANSSQVGKHLPALPRLPGPGPAVAFPDYRYDPSMSEIGTMRVKSGLAEMLKGGVIMDVVDAEQAKIAEDAGAVAVMALERVPADIRRDGGVARMSDP